MARPHWPIWLGLLLLIGALGATLWYATDSPRGSARAPAAGRPRGLAPAPDPGPTPGAELVQAELPEALGPLEPGSRERQLLGSGHPFLETQPIEPAPDDALDLLVVTGDSRAPVPGAVVAFLDERALVDEDMLAVRAGTLTLDEVLDRVGRRFRADENGLARIPVPRGFGFVAGGTKQLWGMLEFSAHELEPVLVVAPDPPLLVRVVDENGRPVGGVPVALRQRFEQLTQDLFATSSAPGTGVALLRHIQRYVTEKERDGQPLVALAVLSTPPVEHMLDPLDFPTAAVELVLPPTGAIELKLENGRGQPFTAPVVVRVVRSPSSGSKQRALERDVRVQRVAQGGRLVLGHVGLGLDLTLSLEAEEYAPILLDHRGPERAGELVKIRAAITERVPVLVGRALGPDGAPLSSERLDARITLETPEDKTNITRRRTRTDALGRFRHSLPRDWSERSGSFVLELLAEDADGTPLSARVELPARLVVGENELGSVTLEPPPLIVSGLVVDPSGKPVVGAQVGLDVTQSSEDDESVSWRAVWEQRARSDKEGRFSLRGELDAALLGLTATHPDHAKSERVVATPGSRDARIVLTPAGRIAGRVLFHEGFPHELFQVHALREPQPGPSYYAQVQADGSFLFTGVRDGSYRVAVALRDEATCGEEISGVVVRAAETSTDERLQGIDLRERLSSFSLEVVDSSGAPLAQGVVSRKLPGAAEFEAGRTWLRRGRADIATCSPAVDLEIDVPGYRTVTLEAVSADQRVTMLPGPRLAFTLRNAPPLDPDCTLGIQIRFAESGRWKPAETVWFDDQRPVEIEAKSAGKHEVYVMFQRRTAEGRRTQQLSAGPETTVEVTESGALQVFEVELGEATLRRLERM